MCICTPSLRTPICPNCATFMEKNRVGDKTALYLIRGLPGSGKSTMAKTIRGNTGVHVEADMFFHRNPRGEYMFDATKLGAAHLWCKSETIQWLRRGEKVVVSNTFTTLKELRPYFAVASTFGIVPTVILMQNSFPNVHGVPEETMTRMKDRFEMDISPLFLELATEASYGNMSWSDSA